MERTQLISADVGFMYIIRGMPVHMVVETHAGVHIGCCHYIADHHLQIN